MPQWLHYTLTTRTMGGQFTIDDALQRITMLYQPGTRLKLETRHQDRTQVVLLFLIEPEKKCDASNTFQPPYSNRILNIVLDAQYRQ